jgi:hypothetical protein
MTVPTHGPVKASKAPEAVLEMAKRMTVGRDLQDRLLHDPRMQSKWVSLSRTNSKITRESLDALDGYMKLCSYGVAMVEWRSGRLHRRFTLQEEACAAFFALCTVELNPETKRSVVTLADIDRAAAGWRDAQLHCRIILDDPATDIDPKLAEAAAIVARRFEKEASLMEDQRGGPLVIGNNAKDDELRVRVRNFAVRARRIFGEARVGTIVTVVKVVLNKDINGPQLRKSLKALQKEETQ